jgi:ATP-binding cassette, subfamily F, member 3
MPIVVGKELAKAFGAQDVLKGIDFQIDAGDKIALVGPNGEGKSTLLHLIAGLESASAGQLTVARGTRIGYLPQQAPATGEHTLYESMLSVFAALREKQARLRELEQAMSDPLYHEETLQKYGELQHDFERAGGYTYESEIRRVLAGVGFGPDDLDKPLDVLSGGQRTRALLAQLLLTQPDLLLLDEPTNHLDLKATEWLENYLLEWKGSVVVVAHDRYFLDRVTEKVWDLAFGSLELYKGNYSRYVEQKAERLELRRASYEAQQATIERTEAFIRRYKAGQRAKEARGRLKKLGHLARLERPKEKAVMKLSLQSRGRSGELVLRTRDLEIGFPVTEERQTSRATVGADPGRFLRRVRLFVCPDVILHRLERAALIGPNGSGKTTFLRTILGQIPPFTGSVRVGESVQIGYFSQTHEDLNLTHSPLEEILGIKNLPISQARNFLSRFLFYGDDVFKPLAQMSGGERSRVALAKLTLAGANLLVLDEPTNHLDIASREILEEVLLDFDGTILFVSHDRYLVDALATQTWVLEDDRLRVFDGNYTDYLAQRQAEEQARQDANGQLRRGSPAPRDERTEARRRQQDTRRQMEHASELEKAIADLESRLAELTDQINLASQEQRLNEVYGLGIEYANLEGELERLMAEWVELGVEA